MLVAVSCRDFVAPERVDPGGPAFSTAGTPAAITGSGALGDGPPVAFMDRQEFDFDVTGTPGGRLFMRDFRAVRADGSIGSLTADPASDQATVINAFVQTSATCVSFSGIGRLDTDALVDFSVDACDNASPGAGEDFFGISVPDIGYSESGVITEGEIALSGGTNGDLDVTTVTTGSDLDADGYTVTVDRTTSQSIGTNGTVHFVSLPEGDHRVELSGLASNCTPSGANPRTVTVVGGSVASTTFDVTCTATIPAGTRVNGRGALGDGLAVPTMNRFEFDFDVTSALSGRVLVTDYSIVRGDGSPARMTVDPADPGTGITSFSRTSTACVRFGGVGRLNEGGGSRYAFFIDACDNASPGRGADTFSITLPDRPYSKSGTLTEGDIAISTF